MLKKYDQGTPMQNLYTEYGIGKSTVYDTIKQKIFFFDSDSPFEMGQTKNYISCENQDLDKVMIN